MAGTLGSQGYFLGSTARHPPDRSGTERQPGGRPANQGTGRAEPAAQSGGGRQPVWEPHFSDRLSAHQNTFALVRMRSNNVLYGIPELREPGKKGAPKK